MNGFADMKRAIKFSAVLLLGVAAVVAEQAAAAPQTVAEIANYTGADRQAVLEAGAKKEGKVLVYGSLTQAEPIFDAFSKKYPFVRFEIFRGDSTETVRRLVEEYKAGKYLADVIGSPTGSMYLLRDSGILQPYITPEHAMFKKEAIGPDRYWTLDIESYVSLGYNTKLLPEKDAPATVDDLLDPNWRGKIAISSLGVSTVSNWVGATIHEKGEDFLRQLGKQNIRVYPIGGRALANLVVTGEVMLSPTIFNTHMFSSKAKGASVAWRPLGEVYANISGMALAAKAPHPHAAMLWIDFDLSRDGGQKIRNAQGYGSGRTDIDPPPGSVKPNKVLYLTEDPNYARDYEKWTALAHQVFGKAEK